MNNKTIAITVLSAALAAGCNQEPTTSQQLDRAQAETMQASQAMKDYTYTQKTAFVEKMQAQLAQLDADLDQLSTKVESSSDAVKAEARPKLQLLRDQSAQLKKQLEDVKNASASAWENAKNGFRQAYESTKDGFEKARQYLSDKIAP